MNNDKTRHSAGPGSRKQTQQSANKESSYESSNNLAQQVHVAPIATYLYTQCFHFCESTPLPPVKVVRPQ